MRSVAPKFQDGSWITEALDSQVADLKSMMWLEHTWPPVLEIEAEPLLLKSHTIFVDVCFLAMIGRLMGYLGDERSLQRSGLFPASVCS